VAQGCLAESLVIFFFGAHARRALLLNGASRGRTHSRAALPRAAVTPAVEGTSLTGSGARTRDFDDDIALCLRRERPNRDVIAIALRHNVRCESTGPLLTIISILILLVLTRILFHYRIKGRFMRYIGTEEFELNTSSDSEARTNAVLRRSLHQGRTSANQYGAASLSIISQNGYAPATAWTARRLPGQCH